MGYYTKITDFNMWFKSPQHVVDSLDYVKEKMFSEESLSKYATGVRYPKTGDVFKDKWYAWTDTDTCISASSIEELICQFVDHATIDEMGLFTELEFDSKSGNEKILFEFLAPFIKSGCYIEWLGSDDERWRWDFDGSKMTTKVGRIVWE